jgi:hypothetical protein
MDGTSLIIAIVNGEFDDDLEGIKNACRQREKVQGDINLMTLKPGTKVRLRGLSPQYLNGQTGVVAAGPRRGKRIRVNLDSPVGRFTKTITPPASCVEVLS